MLVLTATPVHEIPERLDHLRAALLGRPLPERDADATDEVPVKKPRRRRDFTDEPMVGDEAYEQAAIVDYEEKRKGGKGKAAPTPAPISRTPTASRPARGRSSAADIRHNPDTGTATLGTHE